MSKKTLAVILIVTALVVCIVGVVLAINLFGPKAGEGSSASDKPMSDSQSAALSSLQEQLSSNPSKNFSSVVSSMTSTPISSAATSSGLGYTPFDPVAEGMTLAWSDDFDGTKLDSSKWEPCPEYNRGDVGSKWDDDMVSLDGKGNLVLKVGIKDGQVVSGAVRTMNKRYRPLFEQAHGYFEIRTKLQSIPGFWGAFWLMSRDQSKVGNGAVDGAEIDIFESFDYYGGRINYAVHWDGYEADHKSIGGETTNKSLYDGQYHTFGLLWNDDGYFFYVDGKRTYKMDKNTYNYPGSCQTPCYLKISTEVGTWAGTINKNQLPTDGLVVDYVKVYK